MMGGSLIPAMLAAASPVPTPVTVDVDPNRVTPGLLGFLALVVLIIAVVFLYYSMRKQLGRIDFEEGALPAGVRPLPTYATRAERRKAAAAADAAAAEAAASVARSKGGQPAQPRTSPAGSPDTT